MAGEDGHIPEQSDEALGGVEEQILKQALEQIADFSVQEEQEIVLFDESSGEYQTYLYIPPPPAASTEEQPPPKDEHIKQCVVCRKALLKKNYLRHLEENHPEVVLKCPRCPELFRSAQLLQAHYRGSHGGGAVKGLADVDGLSGVVTESRANASSPPSLIGHANRGGEAADEAAHMVVAFVGESEARDCRLRDVDAVVCKDCNRVFPSFFLFSSHKRRKNFCVPSERIVPVANQGPELKKRMTLNIMRRNRK